MAKVDPNDYINKILGPAASTVAHNDTSPQLPASIMIAQAIQECGFDDANFTGWNVFNIRYAASISTGPENNGWCTFNSIEEACAGYCKNMKAGSYDTAIAKLKPKLEDNSAEDKLAYFAALLPIYAPPTGNNVTGYYSNVVGFINEYDLFKWDDPKMAGKKVDPEMASKIAASMKNGPGGLSGKGRYGVGFDRRQMGEIVTLTRLPKDKTQPCEPIYPDLLTVSDVVPKWILDATEVAINKQAEEAARGKISTEKAPDAATSEYQKFLKEYNAFAEGQFIAWLQFKGYGYDGTEAMLKDCKNLYDMASKTDGGVEFVNGIYVGKDEALKKKAQDYINKKKSYEDGISKKGK